MNYVFSFTRSNIFDIYKSRSTGFPFETNNNAHLSQFKIARDLDFLGVQVGYMHCVKPKSKKK